MRLLVDLFLRVLNFFALILFIAILHCLLLQVFRWRYIPGCPGFCCFRLLLCCSLACGNFCFVLFFLLCLFFLFSFFFVTIFLLFSRFLVFDTFLTTANLLAFAFFLLFRVRFSCGMFAHAYGSPAPPFARPKSPLNALWYSCSDRIPHCQTSPPRMLAHNCVLHATNHSFCLVLRLLRACTSPCTHPNPSSPSWVPYTPFCLWTHACMFCREISRPYMPH